MTQQTQKSENQHYVPQFLLKNFATPSKTKKEFYIHSYDKHTDKAFYPNIKGIASEQGFYDFYIGDEDRSLEPALSFLETQTSEAIHKIIETETLHCLSEANRSWLSLFVVIQFMRVKKQREITKKFTQDMITHFQNSGLNTSELQLSYEESDEDIKVRTMKSFVEHSPAIAETVLKKIWVLFKFPDENPLYISDNPVVMHNDEDFGVYGNIGFAVPMIQIYLPLSNNLALGFWCPAVIGKIKKNLDDLEKNIQKLQMQMTMNPNINRSRAEALLTLTTEMVNKPRKLLNCITEGAPVIQTADQVTFMNSLQVNWSHRFVMSSSSDFSLVKRMIADNEKFRTGITIQIN